MATRLAVAIRFFAGGETYDTSVMFGIVQSSMFNSIDAMADVVNGCEDMDIAFPLDHAKRPKIARGFQRKSPLAGFSISLVSFLA